MRKERILAVIMSVLLALSMIPATVFAAEIPALDGKLKIQLMEQSSFLFPDSFSKFSPLYL